MKISVFAGDLCDVQAEVLCTSTNPRLSLAMGTGGSVRGRGGYEILRECEVRRVFIVIYDQERVDDVMRVIQSVIPNAEVDLQHGAAEEMVSMWAAEW